MIKMLKSLIICYSALLVFADVSTKVSNDEVFLIDNGNNLTSLELKPNPNRTHIYHDIDGKKVVSIIVNPIIHNVAQGYGPGAGLGNKPVEPTTSAPVSTTTPPDNLLAATITLFFRKIKFLLRFILNGAAAVLRGVIRFIICTFVPICGLFGVFGDEPVDESLVTPDGVARGLDFLEGFIQKYHDLQNYTLF